MAEKSEQQDRFILRQVRLKNFVKFVDEQRLTFEENGAYYLIGINQSGKSSIFEAIRRCLCLERNSSISSAPNPGRDSIVVSKYEGGNKECLVSFYIRQANEQHNFIKGCVILDHSGQIRDCGLDRICRKKLKVIGCKCDNEAPPKTELFQTEVMDASDWLDKLASWANDYYTGNSCEQILAKHLDGVIFTLPMRGIGPLQWSESEKIKYKEANYKEASDRAEIIQWYLTNANQEVVKDELEIYNIITNANVGEEEYSMKDGSIVVNDNLAILKQSEGFLEAKICSILLTEKTFTTLGLEDPGTGMHMQMIERLRNVMASKVKDKVVIVSTHNRSFVKPELIGNMFFLSRSKDGECEVISGKELSYNKQLRCAVPGSVSADQFATLCFAETTVFVEGASDIQFMDAFTSFMRLHGPMVCDVHFVSMSGAKKYKHFRNCSRALKKRCCFIIDNDAKNDVCQSIKNECKNETTDQTEKACLNEIFFWEFKDLEDLFFNGILQTLQDKGINVTKIKDILQRCVNDENHLKITVGGIIEKAEKPKKFKLFLDGEETFDDRIKLFEFLMDGDDICDKLKSSKAGKDLERFHAFLERFTR